MQVFDRAARLAKCMAALVENALVEFRLSTEEPV